MWTRICGRTMTAIWISPRPIRFRDRLLPVEATDDDSGDRGKCVASVVGTQQINRMRRCADGDSALHKSAARNWYRIWMRLEPRFPRGRDTVETLRMGPDVETDAWPSVMSGRDLRDDPSATSLEESSEMDSGRLTRSSPPLSAQAPSTPSLATSPGEIRPSASRRSTKH